MARTPFKLKSGNSPLKETKDWFNVRGYLKGEQGLIPDILGKSTAETATKISKTIQKGHGKIKKVVSNISKRIKSKNVGERMLKGFQKEIKNPSKEITNPSKGKKSKKLTSVKQRKKEEVISIKQRQIKI
tara:strand:- start:180 stop:569 length:390 start_codon:yes stop_codon:yes gene_type:complete